MDKIILKILSHNKINNLKSDDAYKIIKESDKFYIKLNPDTPTTNSYIESTNNYCKLMNNMIIQIGNSYYSIQKKII